MSIAKRRLAKERRKALDLANPERRRVRREIRASLKPITTTKEDRLRTGAKDPVYLPRYAIEKKVETKGPRRRTTYTLQSAFAKLTKA